MEQLAAKLGTEQAKLVDAIDDLRAAVAPAALAERAKTAASVKANHVLLDQSGKPKVWVMVAASVALALAVTRLAFWLRRDKGASQ